MLAISRQVYNTMLRQPKKGKFQAELYEKFESKNNRFSTTTHVLVSATVKLARKIKLPSGLKLYRGLGRELPKSFDAEDDFGRKGYMEWGFMSTTSNEQVARQVCTLFLSCFECCPHRVLRPRSTRAPRKARQLAWCCA